MRVIVGGPNNTYSLFPDGGSSLLSTQRIDALDPSPGAFLAIGNALFGYVAIYPNSSTTTMLSGPTYTSSPNLSGLGNSLSWTTRGDLLVGNSQTETAGVYLADSNVDGGRVLASSFDLTNPDTASPGNGYGKVVLSGDIIPDFNGPSPEEYIVAAPTVGRVYVFSGTSLVLTLRGGPSFGASLAIEPGAGPSALWIGEPAQDRVYRFVGSAGTVFLVPPQGSNVAFGAAIAVDDQGVVAIGAPRYTDSTNVECGAVFEGNFADSGPAPGLNSVCDAGSSCVLPGCVRALCVGGNFCQRLVTASSCLSSQFCDADNVCKALDSGVDAGPPDAGTPDAGTPDAGTSDAGTSDAGATDAGSLDAGTNDGGSSVDAGLDEVQVFGTCGCTSGGLPVLLLALALPRRSRRR